MNRKISSGVVMFGLSVCALALFTPLVADAAAVYFREDFEGYAVDSYPSTFTQVYNGTGDANQKVISTTGQSGSPTQVFQLQGRSGWASEHIWTLPATLPDTLVIDAYVQPVEGQWPGRFGLRNPAGTWGTRISAVLFDSGGEINALQSGNDNSKIQLGTYTMNTWYRVRLEHHLSARTYDVFIDGVQVGSDIPMHPTLAPTQLHLTAGNTGTPNTIYFDDVGVYDSDPAVLVPTVTTDPATGIVGTSATLNGTVNGNGLETTVTFEYGTDTSYGSTVAAVPNTVNGTVTTAVSADVSGLLPYQTYHFRVVATNAAGSTVGADRNFGSLPVELLLFTVDGR